MVKTVYKYVWMFKIKIKLLSYDPKNIYILCFSGAPPPPMFTEPPPVEDTPRTYRSDLSTARLQASQKPEPDKLMLTAQDTMDALKKSFGFFTKAIVSFILLTHTFLKLF